MNLIRRDSYFYIVSGILLIVSGISVILGVKLIYLEINFLKLTGLIFLFIGIIYTVFNLVGRLYISSRAAIVLTVSFIVLLASITQIPLREIEVSESYTATLDEIKASRIRLLMSSTTGNIYVRSDNLGNLAYNLTIYKLRIPLFMEESKVTIINETIEDTFSLDIRTDSADIVIVLNREIPATIDISTGTGNIYVSISDNSQIDLIKVESSTGNVEFSISNPISIRAYLSLTIGNLNFYSKLIDINSDCRFDIISQIGNIYMTVYVGEKVGCEISAKTDLGAINVLQKGFKAIETISPRSVHIVSENFEKAANRAQFIVESSAGNINIEGIVEKGR